MHVTGQLREGVTATDLVLHITQLLRAQKVVGKFVEFYGEGAASLPVPDRATIGNMSPEYGATMGYFPIDQESVNYLRATGRSEEQCLAFEIIFAPRKCSACRKKAKLITPSRSIWIWRMCNRASPGSKQAAGPDQFARAR